MNQLAKMLEQLRGNTSDYEITQRVLTQAIIQVLQSQRILGEILLQVPRRVVQEQDAILGLFWQKDQIELRVVPQKLAELRSDEVVILLEHEALHLLWQHPLRYANSPTPELVQLATDIAVNQYLPEVPRETMTLEKLQRYLHRRILSHQDSSSYLRLLKNLSDQDKQKLQRKKERGTGKNTQAKPSQVIQETHQGWQLGNAQPAFGIQQLRLAQLKKILHQAYMNTPKKDRGLLPGDILTTLLKPQINNRFNWQQLISRQVETLAAGREEAAYRFNRRQPWRMELPGSVSRLVPRVLVFVDNSGSMSDQEIAGVLTELQYLTVQLNSQVEIIPFDAKVHSEQATRLQPGKNVSYQRTGGGGTCFQAVFDWLQKQHVSRQQATVVILTDGWGESELAVHGYRNVLWLLSTESELSVKSPVMRSVKIGGI